MLPNDTLNTIISTARQSAPAIVPAPGEPDGAYYIRDKDGDLSLTFPVAPNRKHTVADVATLAVVAGKERETGFQLWYGIDGIAIRFGYNLENVGRLNYKRSDQFQTLMRWAAVVSPMSQKELVLLLRSTFADCQRRCPDLLPAVRDVKFKTLQESAGKVENTKVSLGKRIESEVSGTQAIPDQVTFEVPVFDSVFSFDATVRCVLDVDAQRETFRLIPIAADIQRGEDLAVSEIHAALVDALPPEDFAAGRVLRGAF